MCSVVDIEKKKLKQSCRSNLWTPNPKSYISVIYSNSPDPSSKLYFLFFTYVFELFIPEFLIYLLKTTTQQLAYLQVNMWLEINTNGEWCVIRLPDRKKVVKLQIINLFYREIKGVSLIFKTNINLLMTLNVFNSPYLAENLF